MLQALAPMRVSDVWSVPGPGRVLGSVGQGVTGRQSIGATGWLCFTVKRTFCFFCARGLQYCGAGLLLHTEARGRFCCCCGLLCRALPGGGVPCPETSHKGLPACLCAQRSRWPRLRRQGGTLPFFLLRAGCFSFILIEGKGKSNQSTAVAKS